MKLYRKEGNKNCQLCGMGDGFREEEGAGGERLCPMPGLATMFHADNRTVGSEMSPSDSSLSWWSQPDPPLLQAP